MNAHHLFAVMALSKHLKAVEYADPNHDSVSLRYRATEYLELYKLRQQAASARGLLEKRPGMKVHNGGHNHG